MKDKVSKNAIKVLSYIFSKSNFGVSDIILEETSRELEMSMEDVLLAVRELEEAGALKTVGTLTPRHIVQSLAREALAYDFEFLTGGADELSYLEKIGKILLKPEVKQLEVSKFLFSTNIVELKKTVGRAGYNLQFLSKVLSLHREWKPPLEGLLDEVLYDTLYIVSFMRRVKLAGDSILQDLNEFRRKRLETKMMEKLDYDKIDSYEKTREDFVKQIYMFITVLSIFYPSAIHLKSEVGKRICANCDKEIELNWICCKYCGSKPNEILITLTEIRPTGSSCPKCGEFIPRGSTICPKCGASLETLKVNIDEIKSKLGLLAEENKKIIEEISLIKAKMLIEGSDKFSESLKQLEARKAQIESDLLSLSEKLETKSDMKMGDKKQTEVEKQVVLIVERNGLEDVKTLFDKINALLRSNLKMGKNFATTIEAVSLEKEIRNMLLELADSAPLVLENFHSISEKGNGLICRSCGLKNDADAIFCIECGSSLKKKEEEHLKKI